jgi:hypothetical protein
VHTWPSGALLQYLFQAWLRECMCSAAVDVFVCGGVGEYAGVGVCLCVDWFCFTEMLLAAICQALEKRTKPEGLIVLLVHDIST